MIMKNFSASSLRLDTSLWTGLDLSAAFKDDDLLEDGIDIDSHIDILYNPNGLIEKEELLDKIKTILGDDDSLLKDLKKNPEKLNVLDYFELGKIEKIEGDYIVLKLNPETKLFSSLNMVNTGLSSSYELRDSNYEPYMTLAKVKKGKGKDYMFSPILNMILSNAKFNIDDLVLSYKDKEGKQKLFNITSNNAVERFFRQEELERDKEYYKNQS